MTTKAKTPKPQKSPAKRIRPALATLKDTALARKAREMHRADNEPRVPKRFADMFGEATAMRGSARVAVREGGAPPSPRALPDDAQVHLMLEEHDGVLAARRAGISFRELGRLRQGHISIGATLDLHGFRVEAARTATLTFLVERMRNGDRAVLIIHGKGTHSPGGHAVLRDHIMDWLCAGPMARGVAAFVSASEHLGGSGALVVLLAR